MRQGLVTMPLAIALVGALTGCGALSSPVQVATPAPATGGPAVTSTAPSPTRVPTLGAILLATFTPVPTRSPAASPQVAASPPASPEPLPPPSGSPPASPAAAGERVRVLGAGPVGLNLRADPSSGAARVKTVRDGAVLEIVGEDRQADGRAWRNVRDPTDGAMGWAAAQFLTSANAAGALPSSGAPSPGSRPPATAKPSATPGGAAAQPLGNDCPASGPIKGNISASGERIYHVPGGSAYRATRPEACFASPQEAEAAGFRRALR